MCLSTVALNQEAKQFGGKGKGSVISYILLKRRSIHFLKNSLRKYFEISISNSCPGTFSQLKRSGFAKLK